ncbi:MAG: NAD-dependent epimerase/dehydratase family protein [Candidatus Dadabacteria bacterium]|nr:MAG: NAD-dependent epimerase/dehydratase family protein [Candidatus Dadabacteria bacterium]
MPATAATTPTRYRRLEPAPRIMRALVTGATGFVGRRLVAELIARGHSVRGLTRGGLSAAEPSPPERAEYVQGDILDRASLDRAAEGCDVVFHCAWGGTTLAEARRINVSGTEHVVRAAATAGARRIVHMSSMAVHGRKLPPRLTEDHPLTRDGDAYALSKAEGERLAVRLASELGLEIVVLRPTIIYGPGAPLWLLHYFQRAKMGNLRCVRRMEGIANLVHVADVVEALLLAAEAPAELSGSAFLISGPEPVTWREYFEALARLAGRKLPPDVPRVVGPIVAYGGRIVQAVLGQPAPLSPMDLRLLATDTVVDIGRARTLLGYSPRVRLSDGIRDCAEWLVREGRINTTLVAA